jgi:3-methyladenine DNA glycosylase AlkC
MPTADELLSADTVAGLAGHLSRAGGGLPVPRLRERAAALDGLSYSGRVAAVRDAVLADLPEDYARFERIVRTALEDPGFTGWMTMPVGEAVALRGLGVFEPALDLLAALTPRLTSESAVRPFLRADQARALPVFLEWAGHPDEHVRRLASEGSRPRLPWAPRLPSLIADPAPAVPVLDRLRHDESEYVRRSVANHVNDISRDHPAVATGIARRWLADPGPATGRLVRHALRTLVKAGDPEALTLLGHSPGAAVAVEGPGIGTPVVRVGEYLVFDWAVTNTGRETVHAVIDYVVHHVKANGSRTPKVFKLTTRELAPGERLAGTRRHSFRPITTRRYHPGVHEVGVQVNGRPHGTAAFELRI